MTGAQLAAHGLVVAPPTGMDARIMRRPAVNSAERTFPVMHVATFALPDQRDDFGGNITPSMRPSDVLIVLFEYAPESSAQPLFAARGVPRVNASMFSPQRLQRPLPGQLGCQLFFQESGRAFCLYVVAGGRASLPRIVTQVNDALDALQIGPVTP